MHGIDCACHVDVLHMYAITCSAAVLNTASQLGQTGRFALLQALYIAHQAGKAEHVFNCS